MCACAFPGVSVSNKKKHRSPQSDLFYPKDGIILGHYTPVPQGAMRLKYIPTLCGAEPNSAEDA